MASAPLAIRNAKPEVTRDMSYFQFPRVQRVLFDELTTGPTLIAHEEGEIAGLQLLVCQPRSGE
jgi:hypothetical protein